MRVVRPHAPPSHTHKEMDADCAVKAVRGVGSKYLLAGGRAPAVGGGSLLVGWAVSGWFLKGEKGARPCSKCCEAARPHLRLLALRTTSLQQDEIARAGYQQPGCTGAQGGAGPCSQSAIFAPANRARCTRPWGQAWRPTTLPPQETLKTYVVSVRGR